MALGEQKRRCDRNGTKLYYLWRDLKVTHPNKSIDFCAKQEKKRKKQKKKKHSEKKSERKSAASNEKQASPAQSHLYSQYQ